MTSSTLKDNGRLPRKTLASQLDRLDQILDGLAENLNDAVAQAVKDAVGLAIQGVLTEVFTSPELLAKLHPEPPAPALPPSLPSQGPGWLKRLAGLAKGACGKIVNLVRQAWGKVAQQTRGVGHSISTCLTKVSAQVKVLARGFWALLGSAVGLAWQVRKPLLLALGVGAALGLGCYLAGPLVSSTVSGFAGFVGALIASAVNSLRQALLAFELPEA